MTRRVPWAVTIVGLIAVAAYGAGRSAAVASDVSVPPSGQGNATMGVSTPFVEAGIAGAAPDISNLSPRERAARLYDRVMRYVEEGKKDSLEVFAPMAMASFELLGTGLDLDARYDLGRVAAETGVFAVAAAQADTILKTSPTHLLGLALAARTAARQGNAAAAKRSWSAFLAAKEAEIMKQLPEYDAHSADIEAATRLARGGA